MRGEEITRRRAGDATQGGVQAEGIFEEARMEPIEKQQIESNFLANVQRVRSLVGVSALLLGAGRSASERTDVLRSAVVLLHASLEDLVRSSSEILLPHAGASVLKEIGFPDGPEKTKEKFTLGDLYAYKGQSVDALIRTAVQTSLQRSNYGNVSEVSAALRRVGLDPNLLDPDQATLDAMMKRRHLIVHRADKAPTRSSRPKASRVVHLPRYTVDIWIAAVVRAGEKIVSALPLT